MIDHAKTSRLLIIFSIWTCVCGSIARADIGAFLPHSTGNSAELEFFGSYESDDDEVVNFGSSWTDDFLKEKVTLYSDGFFYSPLFMQYHLSLSGALKQENYESSTFPPAGWLNKNGVEYNARFFMLPEKPYNLEVFAVRFEPLYKEHSFIQHDSVENSEGILFRYRRKPYFFHTNYIQNSLDTNAYTTDVKTIGVGGEYFKQYSEEKKMSANADFRPSWFSNSSGLTGDSLDISAANSLDIWDANIQSSLSWSKFNQESVDHFTFKSSNLTWFEQARLWLPYQLTNTAYYRYQNSTNDSQLVSSEQSATRNEFSEELNHRLYESLNSTYSFHYANSDSGSGAGGSSAHSNTLVTNYNKRIPKGTLVASFNIGRALTNSNGVSSILNESHPAVAVPGSFVLNQQDVAADSIDVFVRAPLPPNEVVPLVENINYTILPAAGTYEISIFSLPARFPVPGSYDFQVNYSLTSGEFRLRTGAIGFGINLNLFNDSLTPYFNYSSVSSEVLSGVFLGDPLDATTTTTGVIFHRRAIRLLGEYQTVNWDVSPRDTWRAEIDLNGSLSPTLTYRATAQYQHRYYKKGTVNTIEPYTERVTSASASISKQLFARALLFSLGGTYSNSDGLTNGNAWSLNSNITWKVGKLDFELGATAYHSDVEGEFTVPTRRTHQYYYLDVKRRLF